MVKIGQTVFVITYFLWCSLFQILEFSEKGSRTFFTQIDGLSCVGPKMLIMKKSVVVSDFFCIIAHHDHLATKIMTAVDGKELVIRSATVLCVIYLPFRQYSTISSN